jgi:hypothetical protein
MMAARTNQTDKPWRQEIEIPQLKVCFDNMMILDPASCSSSKTDKHTEMREPCAQNVVRNWFLQCSTKDVNPFLDASLLTDEHVRRFLATNKVTISWWLQARSEEERAALVAAVQRIVNPFEHVLSCIRQAGASSFYAQFPLQSIANREGWPLLFRTTLYDSGYEVLLMYWHAESEMARVLFVARLRNPAETRQKPMSTQRMAVALCEVFRWQTSWGTGMFIPVLLLSDDAALWSVAAAHVAFWRIPTGTARRMFDPTQDDYLQLPGVTDHEMRLLLDWLTVPPFARMIRQSLPALGDMPEIRRTVTTVLGEKFRQWGVPVDLEATRDAMAWACGSKMLIAASCLSQVKTDAALQRLVRNMQDMMRDAFPGGQVHHACRLDPSTRSIVTHLLLRFRDPVNMCGKSGVLKAVREVFKRSSPHTSMLTLIPVDGLGESATSHSPLASAILSTHYPHPSPSRDAFWAADGLLLPATAPTSRPATPTGDLPRWIQGLRDWFYAEPARAEALFEELYLAYPAWLRWDLREHALPMQHPFEDCVRRNSALMRLAIVSDAMHECAIKVEAASRLLIRLVRDDEHCLQDLTFALGDAMGCCLGVLPTLEAFQTPVGQKRQAPFPPPRKPAVSLSSTPMQLADAENPLRHMYARMVEAHALLDGLLQGLAPQKKHDAFWLGLDWDRMFEDVQEAERELSVAYSTACELSDRN